MALSAALELGETWFGIVIAYQTDWPVSFCIALLSAVVYFACLAGSRLPAVRSAR